jgi:hypothetical protein
MSEPARQHPDLFTAVEALAYLHRPCKDPLNPTAAELAVLQTLKENHGLWGRHIGRELAYHRLALDQVVLRLFGMDQAQSDASGSLRLPGKQRRAS